MNAPPTFLCSILANVNSLSLRYQGSCLIQRMASPVDRGNSVVLAPPEPAVRPREYQFEFDPVVLVQYDAWPRATMFELVPFR